MKSGTKFTWSEIPYGMAEIKKDAASLYATARADPLQRGVPCCIDGCDELLARRHRGQKPCFCPKHGISVSTKPTYIYQDSERNFIVGRDILERVCKVEKWRLGFETSEDAVSWNVFVSLLTLGGLAEAFEALTGIIPTVEPELYLWGNRINADCSRWPNLCKVRAELENGLGLPTEPDIMLRTPGQAIVLIEAKFGSSNSVLAGKKGRFGSVTEFLNRYRCKDGGADPLNRKWISVQPAKEILEQLCRNAVFAHWLASECEKPFVINLVRRAAQNDEQLFRRHLAENAVQFNVRTWEDLRGLPVVQGEQASVLRRYLKNKTLNLLPAFHCF
ncbi:MAG: hypothetical protein ACLPLR_08875 [Terriglobales bacterium]